jgi:hypothetical protein
MADLERARGQFFFPPNEAQFYASLAPNPARSALAGSLAAAFHQNLKAVVDAVSVPFFMAHESVCRRTFQALHAAERIRARRHMDENGNVPPSAEEEARAIARRRMDDEVKSEEGGARIADAVLAELSDHLLRPEFARAANELLRQGAVLVWGGLEVLLRDVYRSAKGASAAGPKAAFKELFPATADGRAVMQQLGVWRLFQQRHLIVHSRSIVDADYLAHTGDRLALGVELVVPPDELERHLVSTRDAGVELLRLVP